MAQTGDLDLASLDARVLEIRRAILDRLNTLEDDLKSLVGKYEGAGGEASESATDPTRPAAVAWNLLQELLDYPKAVRHRIDTSLARTPDRPRNQARSLRDISEQVVEAASSVQQWFAAMHSSDIPSALEESLSVAMSELKIENQLGFIAAGNADQLETMVEDARRKVFQDTPDPEVGDAERRDTTPVAVFRSPHHEATAPRHWPIILGHEVAHLKLDTLAASWATEANDVLGTENGREAPPDPVYLLKRLDLIKDFDFDELQRILIEEREARVQRRPPTPHLGHDEGPGRHSGEAPDEDPSLPIQECLRTANDWVEEVVCDLFMVRRFGPAAVAAMASYLTAVGAYVAWRGTHPPGFFRIKLMVDYLGGVPPEMEDVIAPWRKVLAPTPQPTSSAWAAQLMRFVVTNMNQIRGFVDSWPGERYDVTDETRRAAVTLALRQLRFGIPPFSAAKDSFSDTPNNQPAPDGGGGNDGNNNNERTADVAAVDARSDAPAVGSPDRSDSMRGADLVEHVKYEQVQLESADVINAAWLAAIERSRPESLVHEKVPIDRLALKSIETLRMLETHPGIAAETHHSLAEPRPSDPTSGAILGLEEIRRRMSAPDHWRRIIVTPRIEDGGTAASMDLRLGNRFIVFQRTGISSFNAAQGSSPRAVQRLVERPLTAPFVLHPGEVVLAAALEYIALPRDVGAQVITRSAYGRLGLITATAVQVHPLYRGCLTLELVNLGTVPLTLYPGERVAQLVFFNVQAHDPDRGLTPDELFGGSFVCPTAPEFPDVQVDPWIKT
ncbi:dCTP deaminase [Nocardioides sp.]|uniref:dCTP deaminase n=1 Tax=Nocardioides sp. TaxID=35761 RepID=UPI0035ADA314